MGVFFFFEGWEGFFFFCGRGGGRFFFFFSEGGEVLVLFKANGSWFSVFAGDVVFFCLNCLALKARFYIY